jgi:hypothetical protein
LQKSKHALKQSGASSVLSDQPESPKESPKAVSPLKLVKKRNI